MPDLVSPQALTFLMVGCQRCGTTWVDAALREHPEIFLPERKQSYFFDRNYDEGLAWYLARFADRTPAHRAVGEVATGYCLPHAVPRMARDLPHIRLLMTMRHPVERAYSNYMSRRAEEGWSSFEAAVDADSDLTDRGRYADQIEHLLEHYPRERILFLLYDDLAADDRAFLRSILEFLGVDANFESSLFGQQKNASGFPRLRRALTRIGLKPVMSVVSRSAAGAAIRRARKRSGRRSAEHMPPAMRERLLALYRPHNARLSELLGRDLSAWDR